ncbi:MAG: hypothetical protein RR131_02075 [Anaerovorax sp.]
MSLREEMLYDFELNLSRTLISGNLAIVDNVKKLVLVSETHIIADNGKEFTSVSGERLMVQELGEERLRIAGIIKKVELYSRGGSVQNK